MANVSSSNSQKALVPKLRFPGFEGEWHTVRLSDFTDRITRKNSQNESDLPLTISSKDGLVDQISYFNKTVASKDMSRYYLLLNGEFAYNKSYSVGFDFGSIKRLDRYPMGALSTLYICFSVKYYDSDFIKTYFDSLKWYKEIYMIAAEGARNHGLLNVPTEDFFATRHTLPTNLKEQKKIAAFMKLLERRIDAQRRLVEALKSYKRGALSKLFPQKGASVPECRFAGFSGDWEQHKLGELASLITKGTTPIDKSNRGDVNFVKVESIDDLTGQIKITQKISVGEHNGYLRRSQLRENDILFSIAGTLGRVALVNASILPANTNQALAIIRLKRGCLEFVMAFLRGKAVTDFIKKNPTIGAQPNLSLEQVGNLSIFLPSEEEQQKIGGFFRLLDNLTTVTQRKLNKNEQIKVGLLQTLFI